MKLMHMFHQYNGNLMQSKAHGDNRCDGDDGDDGSDGGDGDPYIPLSLEIDGLGSRDYKTLFSRLAKSSLSKGNNQQQSKVNENSAQKSSQSTNVLQNNMAVNEYQANDNYAINLSNQNGQTKSRNEQNALKNISSYSQAQQKDHSLNDTFDE